MKKICKNCEWFLTSKEIDIEIKKEYDCNHESQCGYCVRHAPICAKKGKETVKIAIFPAIGEDIYCGEFVPKLNHILDKTDTDVITDKS